MKDRSPKVEGRGKTESRSSNHSRPATGFGFLFSDLFRTSDFGLRTLLALPLVAAAQVTNDIPPLRPPSAEIPPTFWERYGGGVLIGSVLLLALAGFAVWRRWQPKTEQAIPPEVRARQALESLRDELETGTVLSQISQILRCYLVAAFSLPPEELTTTEFCRVLADNDQIGADLFASLTDFLRECDRRKFAPSLTPTEINAAAQALDLVGRAEERRAQLRQAAEAAASPASKPA